MAIRSAFLTFGHGQNDGPTGPLSTIDLDLDAQRLEFSFFACQVTARLTYEQLGFLGIVVGHHVVGRNHGDVWFNHLQQDDFGLIL